MINLDDVSIENGKAVELIDRLSNYKIEFIEQVVTCKPRHFTDSEYVIYIDSSSISCEKFMLLLRDLSFPKELQEKAYLNYSSARYFGIGSAEDSYLLEIGYTKLRGKQTNIKTISKKYKEFYEWSEEGFEYKEQELLLFNTEFIDTKALMKVEENKLPNFIKKVLELYKTETTVVRNDKNFYTSFLIKNPLVLEEIIPQLTEYTKKRVENLAKNKKSTTNEIVLEEDFFKLRQTIY